MLVKCAWENKYLKILQENPHQKDNMNFDGFHCPACETLIRGSNNDGKIHYNCKRCDYYCISQEVVGEKEIIEAMCNLNSCIIDIGNKLMFSEEVK